MRRARTQHPRTARRIASAAAIAAIAAVAAPAAAGAVTIGPANVFGAPGVAVDAAGTAYIAWRGPEAGLGSLQFCRLPRGAAACDVRSAIPAPGDTVTRAFVVVSGARVVVLQYRYGVEVGMYAFTSTDRGVTFGPALRSGRSRSPRPSRPRRRAVGVRTRPRSGRGVPEHADRWQCRRTAVRGAVGRRTALQRRRRPRRCRHTACDLRDRFRRRPVPPLRRRRVAERRRQLDPGRRSRHRALSEARRRPGRPRAAGIERHHAGDARPQVQRDDVRGAGRRPDRGGPANAARLPGPPPGACTRSPCATRPTACTSSTPPPTTSRRGALAPCSCRTSAPMAASSRRGSRPRPTTSA